MQGPSASSRPLVERDPVPDAVRIQIPATEHWSLLATRSMTWNEMFTRAGMFLTILSAATVALALMAQATGFGRTFLAVALLVLPVVLAVGVLTYLRLGDARAEDRWLVASMNRLRHAYLDLAPDLEPYFVAGHHDDEAGILRTYGPHYRISPVRVLAGTPLLVGILDAVVAGVLVALAARAIGGSNELGLAAGVAGGAASAGVLAAVQFRQIARVHLTEQPRFPS